ncbi:MAG: hypothetical protein KC466_10855, partial [Myxococcales bacterium]|nr:hypothetical protein [Myxococcales bacterium]
MRTSVMPAAHEDLGDWRKLEGPALQGYIRHIAEQGRTIEAARIAREGLGMTLTDATMFVRSITDPNPRRGIERR